MVFFFLFFSSFFSQLLWCKRGSDRQQDRASDGTYSAGRVAGPGRGPLSFWGFVFLGFCVLGFHGFGVLCFGVSCPGSGGFAHQGSPRGCFSPQAGCRCIGAARSILPYSHFSPCFLIHFLIDFVAFLGASRALQTSTAPRRRPGQPGGAGARQFPAWGSRPVPCRARCPPPAPFVGGAVPEPEPRLSREGSAGRLLLGKVRAFNNRL